MTVPQFLPDWAPWWAQLALLVVGLLFALCFLLMPFSVFGVKGRLDGLEARLDEIQGEIRSLALRLPEPMSGYDTDYVLPSPQRGEGARPLSARPPIPPPPREGHMPRRGPDDRPARNEPRLY